MKTILTFLALAVGAFGQEAATGDYVFRKKIARGYESQNITPENGKVLGWTAGVLSNITASSGGGTWGSITGTLSAQTDLNTVLGLKAPAASPTFTGTLSAATVTASGNVTGLNLSGTNTGNDATNTQYSGLAASKANVVSPTFTGVVTADEVQVGLIEATTLHGNFVGTGSINLATFSGPTSDRIFTLPDAAATLLYAGGALGTPLSGTVTNLTGTASININGTVGATTPGTGSFTSIASSGNLTFSDTGEGVALHGGGTVTGASGAVTATPLSGQNFTINATGGGSTVINGASATINSTLTIGGTTTGTTFIFGQTNSVSWSGRAKMTSPADAVVKITNNGSSTGSAVNMGALTVAGLPAAATAGNNSFACVTDASSFTAGSTVAGGGSVKCMVQSNGTNWIMVLQLY